MVVYVQQKLINKSKFQFITFLLSLLSLSWEDGGGGSGGIPMIMLGSLGSNLGNTGLGIDLTACNKRERETKSFIIIKQYN